MKYWICKEEGATREHIFKASDIRQYFGDISPQKPSYKHTDKKRNKPINSAKPKNLTSGAPICSYCNNTRTQPYDTRF